MSKLSEARKELEVALKKFRDEFMKSTEYKEEDGKTKGLIGYYSESANAETEFVTIKFGNMAEVFALAQTLKLVEDFMEDFEEAGGIIEDYSDKFLNGEEGVE